MVVWFLADDGTITPCEGYFDEKINEYIFETNHFSQYVITSFPFTDVTAKAWFYGNVAYVYMNGLMEGTSDTAFNPNGNTTRKMVVTLLHRMAGTPSTKKQCPLHRRYGNTASPYGRNSFYSGNATRAEVAAMLQRYNEKFGN